MQSLLNKEVYGLRDGSRGTIVGDTPETVIIDFSGIQKTVTRGTFKKWFTIIEDDLEVAENGARPTPHNKCRGMDLVQELIKVVNNADRENADVEFTNNFKNCTVRYHRRNVFVCYIGKNHLNVLCHYKSLTPDNLKRATKILPKKWGWPLRVRYTIRSEADFPLLKSVIADGIYYRTPQEDDNW